MKIFFPCLLLVSALTMPLKAQELKNSGFETPGQTLVSTSDAPNGKSQISGTIADGWQDNTSWADVKISYSLDDAKPHSGSYSQRIDVARGFAQFVQPIDFHAGRYQSTVWMRAQPAQWAALSLRMGGPPYTSYAYQPVRVGPQWTEVSIEGTTPSVSGYFMVNVAATGTLWLDDATLTRPAGVNMAQVLSPPKGKIPRAYFGSNVNHMHDPPGFDWPALDFGTFRTWDSGDIWAGIEPQRDVYDWKNLDKDVAQAEKHHTQFLFTLGVTPRWASSQPDTPAVYGIGSGGPPASMADWKAFLRAVATRYKGRIYAYEVWNEPDLAMFYTGTPAQLAAMEKAMAEVVRGIDPAARILTPPPSGGIGIGQLKFLDDYLAAGGGRNADAIGFHDYNYPPEVNVLAVKTFRSVLARYGMEKKPIWDTETGTDLSVTSEADTASFVARAFVLDWALGLDRVFMYAYDGSFTGLDTPLPDGKHRDPARLALSGVAYQQVENWLTGAQMLSCGSDANGLWTAALRRPDGSAAWIVWNDSGTSQAWMPPAKWKVKRQRDLLGQTAPITVPSTAGPAPTLLEP